MSKLTMGYFGCSFNAFEGDGEIIIDLVSFLDAYGYTDHGFMESFLSPVSVPDAFLTVRLVSQPVSDG